MFKRKIINNQKLIITDGMPSSGKALICNLISSLPKVDQWILNHYIDQTVALNKFGKLSLEASKYLILTNHNAFFHDNLLLRHSNFRKKDITSLQNHKRFKFLKERISGDETSIIKKFKNKVIVHYCVHFTSIAKKLFFETFKKNLIYVQIIRSPISLLMIRRIAQWSINIEKIKSRDGYIKYFDKKNKKNIPYFLIKKSKEYLSANKYERAIIIIATNLNKETINSKKLNKKLKSTEIIIPFENLLKNPIKNLNRIGVSLNVKVDKFTFKSIKENNLPRELDYDKEKQNTLKFLKKKIRKKYFLKLLKLEKFYFNHVIKKY